MGKLLVGIAVVLFVSACGLEGDARHGLNGGSYGGGRNGLPSQRLEGAAAMEHARNARRSALICTAIGAFAAIAGTVIWWIDRKEEGGIL